MPRKPRLHVSGAVYHVMLRGNGGQRIFVNKADRSTFEDYVAAGVKRYDHRIHAYCWMSNHVHLALQVGNTPLGRIIQNLASRYAKSFNIRRRKSGHLFQGRYRAILVDADRYLLALVRYIHLNPVRAGIAADPGDYPWSSHRCYLGRMRREWLTTDWVLGTLGPTAKVATLHYEAFIHDQDAPSTALEFRTGSDHDDRVLGNDEFIQQVIGEESKQAQTMDLDTIIKSVSARFDTRLEQLVGRSRARHYARARAVIGYWALEFGVATITDVAVRFNRDNTTLSKSISHYLEQEPELFQNKPISHA